MERCYLPNHARIDCILVAEGHEPSCIGIYSRLSRSSNKVLYKLHLQVKYFTSCNTISIILNGFNEVLYKLRLQVTVL